MGFILHAHLSCHVIHASDMTAISSRAGFQRLTSLNQFPAHILRPHGYYGRRYLAEMPRVAVLYQACEPPIVNGVQKPKKPGGYQDSGADIAYVLKTNKVDIVTPGPNPDPKEDRGWCFPDTEAGILSAIEQGANVLWANTILFASHPLQTSSALDKYASKVKVVGQPPQLVEQYDDKNFVNNLLRSKGTFTLPRSWTVDWTLSLDLNSLPYPIVGKPIRGRGSHGVKVCKDKSDLRAHLSSLFEESQVVMLEEFLSGQEGTITVMPPTNGNPRHWAMPIVVRFNHEDDIAPYNGIVAVTSNSRVPPLEELDQNPHYDEISRECERIANLLRVTAPIRVDVRCFTPGKGSKFAVFDVNMKPNMTGPGRPGRGNQASLTAMAAASLGWDYPTLLIKMLSSARTLEFLRSVSL